MDNIKIKKRIYDGLLLLCIVGIVFLAENIFMHQRKYKKAEKEYETLRKSVQTEQKIDWKKLKKINSDIVAWIKIPGTKINYPVVQAKNNKEYLHKTFFKNYNSSGCIFLDYKCKKDFMSDNNVIYGHHMRDGSMFATFVKYKNRSFWKKHQKIILYLPKETRTLKVIAARANKPEKLPIEFKNKKDRENYLSRIQSISYLPDQSIRKRLYTFVTCSYEKNDYRTYIYAVENQKEVRE